MHRQVIQVPTPTLDELTSSLDEQLDAGDSINFGMYLLEEDFIKVLFERLIDNDTIKKLDVGSTYLSDVGVAQLIELLKENKTIECLIINSVCLSTQMLLPLVETLERRRDIVLNQKVISSTESGTTVEALSIPGVTDQIEVLMGGLDIAHQLLEVARLDERLKALERNAYGAAFKEITNPARVGTSTFGGCAATAVRDVDVSASVDTAESMTGTSLSGDTQLRF